MKKLKSLVLGLSVAALACSTAGAAGLTSYDVRVDSGAGLSGSVRVEFDRGNGTTLSYGRFIGGFTAAFADPANGSGTWYSFCTDLTGVLRSGKYNYYDVPVTDSSPAGADGLYPHWSTGGMQAAAAIYKSHVGGLYESAAPKAYGAALQLAIWEALYDTDDYSLEEGRFRVTQAPDAVRNYYNSFILSAGDNFDGVIWLKPDPRKGSQGNLRLVSVPEPAMLLSSLLAIGLGCLGRRRMV
jgi:hypothetical protein